MSVSAQALGCKMVDMLVGNYTGKWLERLENKFKVKTQDRKIKVTHRNSQ